MEVVIYVLILILVGYLIAVFCTIIKDLISLIKLIRYRKKCKKAAQSMNMKAQSFDDMVKQIADCYVEVKPVDRSGIKYGDAWTCRHCVHYNLRSCSCQKYKDCAFCNEIRRLKE